VIASPAIPLSGYEPQTGDEKLARGPAFLDLATSFIAVTTAQPSQANAILQGNLTDACHHLRVVISKSEQEHTISLEVYSMADPSKVCAAMLQPFSASIPLGNYPTGMYTVLVNGEKLAEISTDYAPQPGDDQLIHGEVSIDMQNSQLVTTGIGTIQASVILKGTKPGCHQLRVVVNQQDEENEINLEVYSVGDPKAICTAVLQPFEASIYLGSFSSGHILVHVNGEVLGEFGLDYEPQPGDDRLTRGKAFVDLENSQLITSLTRPIQVEALLRGSLPDPCHQLRVVVSAPDASNKINLEVYSLVDPAVTCTTVLKPFDATISLGAYPKGHYIVDMNGELLGEFDG